MSWLDRLREQDLDIAVSELLVATADETHPLIDDAVGEVLPVLRQKLGMDVVFVSEFVDGERVFRYVDRSQHETVIRPGQSNPIEESVCLRVVDGRLPELIPDMAELPKDSDVPPLPFRIGAHLSTPVVLAGGETYGTLCCFSTRPKPELQAHDLETLRLCAKLVARKIDMTTRRAGFGDPPSQWALEPLPEEPKRRR